MTTIGKWSSILERGMRTLTSLWQALRPHQWSKNLLLFVPMIVGHRFDYDTTISTCIAYVVFCLAASAVYVLNDLFDATTDRQHPTKQLRPFASGALSVRAGVTMLITLFATTIGLSAAALPPRFLVIMGGYYTANICYTLWLKQQPLLDVMALAAMYVVRLEAGGAAGDIPLSPWLVAFSLFFFTSLAFVKRYTELRRVMENGGRMADGRGYTTDDMETLLTLGTASGYVSVLVLALYMNSDQMRLLYDDSRLLWLICPVVMYWISRVWLLARRGTLHEDPVVFAFRDRASVVVAVVCLALLASAIVSRLYPRRQSQIEPGIGPPAAREGATSACYPHRQASTL